MTILPMQIEDFFLREAGEIPNNAFLPLLVYRKAFNGEPEAIAGEMEEVFDQNGWKPAWRYGIYDFPHYHSTAHEVVGVYRGNARVLFGHVEGVEISLAAGDVVVIPAGVGHQGLESSADFHAVGAYPKGQEPDMMRGRKGERPAADQRIEEVPLPGADPVLGTGGPLMDLW